MNVFLDSGAFSAWRKNEVIDMDKYIEFCHKHKDNVEVYATLDVIGDPEKTWENHRIMEEAGLNPLPVYHCGSPAKYLHKCMDYEYFGLGGIAAQSEKVRLTFLDHVFKEISDKKGIPTHKTHGLGMTSFNLMREYPFYSVDSTSFALYAAYGIVLIPRKKNGQYDYTQEPYQVFISSQSNKKGYGAHFKTMPKAA